MGGFDWRDTALAISIVIMFVIQPTLTSQCASFFACVQLGPQEAGNVLEMWKNTFLVDELTVACGSFEHWRIMVNFGLPMGVLYGLWVLVVKKGRIAHLASTINEETLETFLDAK